MTVQLLRWPEDQHRRVELQQSRLLRLLLVSCDADPPVVVDPLEDWVRLPAAPTDVRARVESLRSRASVSKPQGTPSTPPTLVDGLLRNEFGSVLLSTREARIVGLMLERYGLVVDRQSMLATGWPNTEPTRNVLDVCLHRIRNNLQPVSLQVRTVRKRGYALEPRHH